MARQVFEQKIRRRQSQTEIIQAVKVLKRGGSVVFPTETGYGLAVDATNLKAINKLYRLKGRTFNKPIHVIFPNLSLAIKAVRLNTTALKLLVKFVPGPLTLVLPLASKSRNWEKLSARTGKLGLRFPDSQIAMELVQTLNRPITATSANISGKPSTYSVLEIEKQFASHRHKPDLYLDIGKIKKQKPSTVVELDKNRVKIIREGPVTEKQIKKVLTNV